MIKSALIVIANDMIARNAQSGFTITNVGRVAIEINIIDDMTLIDIDDCGHKMRRTVQNCKDMYKSLIDFINSRW